MRLVWDLAFRYLISRKVAIVAILSIAVGVMAMIVVTSLMDGVQSFIRDHIKGTEADIAIEWSVLAPEGELWETCRLALGTGTGADKGRGTWNLAPRLRTDGLIAPGENPGPDDEEKIHGVRLVGIEPSLELRVTPLVPMMDAVQDAGRFVPKSDREDLLARPEGPWILLGDSLAEKLGVGRAGVGLKDSVTVAVGRVNTDDVDQTKARTQVFRVLGCFSSGRQDYDEFVGYVHRGDLWKFRGYGPSTTSVHMSLSTDADLTGTAKRLAKENPELYFESWEASRANELRAIRDQKRIMVVILFMIIAVAAVAILGIVYLLVVEKVRDIGILRSMGLSRTRLVLVFTLYGVTLGILGSLVGLLAGLQLTERLDDVVVWLSNRFGVDLFNAEIYRFKTVPTLTRTSTVVTILVVSQAISFVAAFVPALKAASLTPDRALRSA